MEKRTFEFTHEEVELLLNSLSFLYERKLNVLKELGSFEEAEINTTTIRERLNKYDYLRFEIVEGLKDV